MKQTHAQLGSIGIAVLTSAAIAGGGPSCTGHGTIDSAELDNNANIDLLTGVACINRFEEVTSNHWSIETKQTSSGTGLTVISGFNSSDIIDRINILFQSGIGQNLMLLNISNDGDPASISAIDEIEHASNVRLDISLINISGDIGLIGGANRIEARNIRTMTVGGDVYSDIVLDGSASPRTGTTIVDVEGDWIEGSYVNENNDNLDFYVAGNVGSVSESVDIWSGNIIDSIEIDGNFYGRIGENDEGFTGHPDIALIDIEGNFNGTAAMTVNSLGEMVVNSDFDADLSISSATGSAALYDIAGEFASTATLTLPTDGLEGQIIINTSNASDDWLGDVIVGSTTLAKDYTELSDELGGGAVAIAPFNFHQRESAPGAGNTRDCDPYMLENVSISPSGSLTEITISHYGPVYAIDAGVDEDEDPDFRIEFKPDYFPTNWVDRTDDFRVDFANTGYDNATATRTVVIEAAPGNSTGFKAAGRWRIRPLAGQVKCAKVTRNPDVLYDSSIVSGDLGVTSGVPRTPGTSSASPSPRPPA